MKISPPCLSSIWTCHFFPVILPSSKYDHNIPLLSHPVATYEHPSSALLFLCYLLRGNQILLPFLLLNLITFLVKIRLRCVCGLIKGHPNSHYDLDSSKSQILHGLEYTVFLQLSCKGWRQCSSLSWSPRFHRPCLSLPWVEVCGLNGLFDLKLFSTNKVILHTCAPNLVQWFLLLSFSIT